jgi:hypothetical protein
MKKLAVVLGLGMMSLGIPSLAFSDPVRIHLAVTMTEGVGGDPADILGGPLPPGSTFTGLFTYDPGSPDTVGDEPGHLTPYAGVGLELSTDVQVTNQTTASCCSCNSSRRLASAWSALRAADEAVPTIPPGG